MRKYIAILLTALMLLVPVNAFAATTTATVTNTIRMSELAEKIENNLGNQLSNKMLSRTGVVTNEILYASLGDALKLPTNSRMCESFSDYVDIDNSLRGLIGAVASTTMFGDIRGKKFEPNKQLTETEIDTAIDSAVAFAYGKASKEIVNYAKAVVTKDNVITGSVKIDSNSSIKNVKILGDLYLQDYSGNYNQSFLLDNVQVLGKIKITNNVRGTLTLQQVNQHFLQSVEIGQSNSVKLEGDYNKVYLTGKGSTARFKDNSHINYLEISADDTITELSVNTTIDELKANRSFTLTGSGTVVEANIPSSGVTVYAPSTVNINKPVEQTYLKGIVDTPTANIVYTNDYADISLLQVTSGSTIKYKLSTDASSDAYKLYSGSIHMASSGSITFYAEKEGMFQSGSKTIDVPVFTNYSGSYTANYSFKTATQVQIDKLFQSSSSVYVTESFFSSVLGAENVKYDSSLNTLVFVVDGKSYQLAGASKTKINDTDMYSIPKSITNQYGYATVSIDPILKSITLVKASTNGTPTTPTSENFSGNISMVVNGKYLKQVTTQYAYVDSSSVYIDQQAFQQIIGAQSVYVNETTLTISYTQNGKPYTSKYVANINGNKLVDISKTHGDLTSLTFNSEEMLISVNEPYIVSHDWQVTSGNAVVYRNLIKDAAQTSITYYQDSLTGETYLGAASLSSLFGGSDAEYDLLNNTVTVKTSSGDVIVQLTINNCVMYNSSVYLRLDSSLAQLLGVSRIEFIRGAISITN